LPTPPSSPSFPYTTLFRSHQAVRREGPARPGGEGGRAPADEGQQPGTEGAPAFGPGRPAAGLPQPGVRRDRRDDRGERLAAVDRSEEHTSGPPSLTQIACP